MVLVLASLADDVAHFLTPTNCAGIAGIGLGASWALMARRAAILTCQTLGGLFFAVHFFLLGSIAGAVMCLAAALQSTASRFDLRRPTLLACYAATLALALGVALAQSRGVAPFFAATGLLFATIGRLQRDTQRMRLAFLACTGAWAVHNFLVGSIVGNCSDGLTLASILAGFWAQSRRDHRAALLPPQPASA